MNLKRYFHSVILRKIVQFFSLSLLILLIQSLFQLYLAKVLLQNDFGIFKMFVLYSSFGAILSFGFREAKLIDQCNISKELDNNIFRKDFTTFLIMQLILSGVVIIIGIVFFPLYKAFVILLSFNFFLNNIFDYQLNYFKATKKFNVINYIKLFEVLLFIVSIIVVKSFGALSPRVLMVLIVGAALLRNVLLSILYPKLFTPASFNTIKLKKHYLIPIFSFGFPILLANYINVIFSKLDKTIVSISFSPTDFAIYSFASIFLVGYNLIISSSSTILLPFLFQEYKDKISFVFKKAYSLLIILSFLIIPIYVLVKYIVIVFFENYFNALPIFKVLLLVVVITSFNILLFNNYYKRLKQEKRYLWNNAISLIISVALFFTAYLLNISQLIWFSYLALVSAIIRNLINDIYIRKKLRIKLYGIVYSYIFLFFIGAILYFL